MRTRAFVGPRHVSKISRRVWMWFWGWINAGSAQSGCNAPVPAPLCRRPSSPQTVVPARTWSLSFWTSCSSLGSTCRRRRWSSSKAWPSHPASASPCQRLTSSIISKVYNNYSTCIDVKKKNLYPDYSMYTCNQATKRGFVFMNWVGYEQKISNINWCVLPR